MASSLASRLSAQRPLVAKPVQVAVRPRLLPSVVTAEKIACTVANPVSGGGGVAATCPCLKSRLPVWSGGATRASSFGRSATIDEYKTQPPGEPRVPLIDVLSFVFWATVSREPRCILGKAFVHSQALASPSIIRRPPSHALGSFLLSAAPIRAQTALWNYNKINNKKWRTLQSIRVRFFCPPVSRVHSRAAKVDTIRTGGCANVGLWGDSSSSPICFRLDAAVKSAVCLPVRELGEPSVSRAAVLPSPPVTSAASNCQTLCWQKNGPNLGASGFNLLYAPKAAGGGAKAAQNVVSDLSMYFLFFLSILANQETPLEMAST